MIVKWNNFCIQDIVFLYFRQFLNNVTLWRGTELGNTKYTANHQVAWKFQQIQVRFYDKLIVENKNIFTKDNV